MNILIQIALLTGLVAGVSLIWLVGRAFSKHALWGLAVLFLSPLTAVIFGMRYWRDEKGPFLVYLATFTIAVTLGLYVFTAKDGWDVLRNALHTGQHVNFQISGGIGEGSFVQTSLNTVRDSSVHVHNDKAAGTRQEQQEQSEPTQPDPAEPATNAGGQATPETGTPKVTSAKSIDSTVRYRTAYVPISPSMADDYIGMTVKVKRLNRPEQDCVLRSVTPTALGFEQHARGGTFSFKYKHSEIEKLRVLVKQTY